MVVTIIAWKVEGGRRRKGVVEVRWWWGREEQCWIWKSPRRKDYNMTIGSSFWVRKCAGVIINIFYILQSKDIHNCDVERRCIIATFYFDTFVCLRVTMYE